MRVVIECYCFCHEFHWLTVHFVFCKRPISPWKRFTDAHIFPPSISIAISGLYKALPDLIKKHRLTFLIPNDAAFKKLPNATLSQLASKPKLLNQILSLHAQRGIWNAAGLEAKPLHYQVHCGY